MTAGSTAPPPDPFKRDVLRAYISQFPHYRVAIDSTFPGVVLPPELKGTVVLDLGCGLPLPAVVWTGDYHFGGELSFNRSSFSVRIPWGALQAVGTETGVTSFFGKSPAPSPRPALSVVR